jgi:hypothetical protein
MAELNQINVATKRFIAQNRKQLADNIFNASSTMAFFKDNLKEDYTGGRFIQETFLYDVLPGGAYAKGDTFNITQKQFMQAGQFLPKYQYVDFTVFKEDVQVENVGDAQIFSIIKSGIELAHTQAGQQLAVQLFLNGQDTGYGNFVNGLTEALNDGSTAGWNGNTYSTYGTITRNGAVGTALNSVPYNVAGTLEYTTLEEQWMNAYQGVGIYTPNLIVTTPKGFSYTKEKFQAQQVYETVTDLPLGITGMKFNGSVIIPDHYCPGTYISGTNNKVATGFMIGSGLTAYPTITSETMWILNARKDFINLYVSSDPEFQWGFSGFKPAQNNNVLAGQIQYAGNVTTVSPRNHIQLFGITG